MINPYNTSVKNYQAPKPLTSMTIGEAQDWGHQLIHKTRNDPSLGLAGTGYGSSAKGAYQATNAWLDDWGKATFGNDYKNQPFSQENQDKIYDKYITTRLANKNYSGILSDFQGLKKTGITPEQLASLTPEQIRNATLATETGKGLPKDWANQVVLSKAPYKVNTSLNGTPAAVLDNKVNNYTFNTSNPTPVEPSGLAATYRTPPDVPQVVQQVNNIPNSMPVDPVNITRMNDPALASTSNIGWNKNFINITQPDMLSGLAGKSIPNSIPQYNKRLQF